MSFSHTFRQKLDQAPEATAAIPIIAMPLHLVDFTKHTEGIQVLLQKMQQANIPRAVVFGLPVRKKSAHLPPSKQHFRRPP
jgi:hypothetical protein